MTAPKGLKSLPDATPSGGYPYDPTPTEEPQWKRDPKTDETYDFDEISPYALEEWAKVCREGHKHGKSNWRDHPQPEHIVMNHIMAHLNEYRKGDRSELHLGKVIWGCAALIHYREST